MFFLEEEIESTWNSIMSQITRSSEALWTSLFILEVLKIEGGKTLFQKISGELNNTLDNLRYNFSLNVNHIFSDKSEAPNYVIGDVTNNILDSFKETQFFLASRENTNIEIPENAYNLFMLLLQSDKEILNEGRNARGVIIFQRKLVEKFIESRIQQNIKIYYEGNLTSRQIVSQILAAAKQNNKWAPVAMHLVGAKLQLRFPKLAISNFSVSASDASTGRKGDFMIRDTVFHVTVAPGENVIDACERNLADGLRVYLLVPAERLGLIQAQVEDRCNGRVQLISIENFISQNLDELGEFTSKIGNTIKDLFDKYNQRVDEAERDKSLLIEIPPALEKHND